MNPSLTPIRTNHIFVVQHPLISPYVSRVLPNVQQMLNTTKQRLAILPGPPIEATRAISDIQEILNRKPI